MANLMRCSSTTPPLRDRRNNEFFVAGPSAFPKIYRGSSDRTWGAIFMHGRILARMAAVVLSVSSIACGDSIFINEFHYDDLGSDNNEFVEVAVPTGTDLAGLNFAIYRGSGIVFGSGLVELASVGNTVGDFTLYWMNFSMEDGPGGVALLRDATVLEFLSYEGVITATNGPAMGATSVDIGATETGQAVGTSVGLLGAGNKASDFSWVRLNDDTPGAINTGQTFTPMDVAAAPLPLAGLAGVGLVGDFAMTRKRLAITSSDR